MALFFDQTWFDARLVATGATRADVARLLSVTELQVDELWKDQRELKAEDVLLLARFLNASPEDIAKHAGISTPVPSRRGVVEGEIRALQLRVDRLESQLSLVLDKLRKLEASDRG